jgi:hypothetical protein
MMGKSELNVLFFGKLEEFKRCDSVRGRILELEIVTWAEMIPAGPDASTWDVLYSQIQHLSVFHKISEEQVVHELFTPGSVESFVMFLQAS